MVKRLTVVALVVTPCSLTESYQHFTGTVALIISICRVEVYLDDGGNTFLQHTANDLQDHMVPQPKKL